MICPGGRLHWGGAYIRNYMVNTCQDLEDTCYEAFTQGRSTYARNWWLEGHLLKGGVFQKLAICSSLSH